MSIFDGISDERQKRIREELTRELRRGIAEGLRATIRDQVEDDVRNETRRAMLREIEEREPTEAERDTFREFVKEVELDAYAQATMASDVAERSDEQLTRSRRCSEGATIAGVASLVVAWLMSGVSVALLTGSVVVAVCALASALWLWRRNIQLEESSKKHRKVSSDYLIIAERAKAYRMVHAERTNEAEELHKILEELRIAKERQDRTFHADPAAIETARDSVRHRVEPAASLRIEDEEEAELEAEAEREAAGSSR